MNVLVSPLPVPFGTGVIHALRRPVVLAFVAGAVVSAGLMLARDHYVGARASEPASHATVPGSNSGDAPFAPGDAGSAQAGSVASTRIPGTTPRARAASPVRYLLSRRPDLLSAPESWTYDPAPATDR